MEASSGGNTSSEQPVIPTGSNREGINGFDDGTVSRGEKVAESALLAGRRVRALAQARALLEANHRGNDKLAAAYHALSKNTPPKHATTPPAALLALESMIANLGKPAGVEDNAGTVNGAHVLDGDGGDTAVVGEGGPDDIASTAPVAVPDIAHAIADPQTPPARANRNLWRTPPTQAPLSQASTGETISALETSVGMRLSLCAQARGLPSPEESEHFIKRINEAHTQAELDVLNVELQQRLAQAKEETDIPAVEDTSGVQEKDGVTTRRRDRRGASTSSSTGTPKSRKKGEVARSDGGGAGAVGGKGQKRVEEVEEALARYDAPKPHTQTGDTPPIEPEQSPAGAEGNAELSSIESLIAQAEQHKKWLSEVLEREDVKKGLERTGKVVFWQRVNNFNTLLDRMRTTSAQMNAANEASEKEQCAEKIREAYTALEQLVEEIKTTIAPQGGSEATETPRPTELPNTQASGEDTDTALERILSGTDMRAWQKMKSMSVAGFIENTHVQAGKSQRAEEVFSRAAAVYDISVNELKRLIALVHNNGSSNVPYGDLTIEEYLKKSIEHTRGRTTEDTKGALGETPIPPETPAGVQKNPENPENIKLRDAYHVAQAQAISSYRESLRTRGIFGAGKELARRAFLGDQIGLSLDRVSPEAHAALLEAGKTRYAFLQKQLMENRAGIAKDVAASLFGEKVEGQEEEERPRGFESLSLEAQKEKLTRLLLREKAREMHVGERETVDVLENDIRTLHQELAERQARGEKFNLDALETSRAQAETQRVKYTNLLQNEQALGQMPNVLNAHAHYLARLAALRLEYLRLLHSDILEQAAKARPLSEVYREYLEKRVEGRVLGQISHRYFTKDRLEISNALLRAREQVFQERNEQTRKTVLGRARLLVGKVFAAKPTKYVMAAGAGAGMSLFTFGIGGGVLFAALGAAGATALGAGTGAGVRHISERVLLRKSIREGITQKERALSTASAQSAETDFAAHMKALQKNANTEERRKRYAVWAGMVAAAAVGGGLRGSISNAIAEHAHVLSPATASAASVVEDGGGGGSGPLPDVGEEKHPMGKENLPHIYPGASAGEASALVVEGVEEKHPVGKEKLPPHTYYPSPQDLMDKADTKYEGIPIDRGGHTPAALETPNESGSWEKVTSALEVSEIKRGDTVWHLAKNAFAEDPRFAELPVQKQDAVLARFVEEMRRAPETTFEEAGFVRDPRTGAFSPDYIRAGDSINLGKFFENPSDFDRLFDGGSTSPTPPEPSPPRPTLEVPPPEPRPEVVGASIEPSSPAASPTREVILMDGRTVSLTQEEFENFKKEWIEFTNEKFAKHFPETDVAMHTLINTKPELSHVPQRLFGVVQPNLITGYRIAEPNLRADTVLSSLGDEQTLLRLHENILAYAKELGFSRNDLVHIARSLPPKENLHDLLGHLSREHMLQQKANIVHSAV